MKQIFISKIVILELLCFLLIGCEEKGGGKMDDIVMDRVTELCYDTYSIKYDYNDAGTIRQFSLYNNDLFVDITKISELPSGLGCIYKGFYYKILRDAIGGTFRVIEIESTVGDSFISRVTYGYTEDAFVSWAVVERAGQDTYVESFIYMGDSINIVETNRDKGEIVNSYVIHMSSEKNTGNVCPVLTFASDSKDQLNPNSTEEVEEQQIKVVNDTISDTTIVKVNKSYYEDLISKYVINPDFYLLNIYGKTIDRLPKEQVVKRDSQGKILSVGKYQYQY